MPEYLVIFTVSFYIIQEKLEIIELLQLHGHSSCGQNVKAVGCQELGGTRKKIHTKKFSKRP